MLEDKTSKKILDVLALTPPDSLPENDFEYGKERMKIVNDSFDLHFYIVLEGINKYNKIFLEDLKSLVSEFIDLSDKDFEKLVRKLKVIVKSMKDQKFFKEAVNLSEINKGKFLHYNDPTTTAGMDVGFLIVWLGGIYGAWNESFTMVLKASWYGAAIGALTMFGGRLAFDILDSLGYEKLNPRKKRSDIFNERIKKLKEIIK